MMNAKLPEGWSRKQQVQWVATRHEVIDREYAAWAEKEFHGDPYAEMMSDKEVPAEIMELVNEYHSYLEEIRKAAVLLLKYYEEIEGAAKAHELTALRVLLNNENIFYEEIPSEEIEKKFENLKANAHDAEQGIPDTEIG